MKRAVTHILTLVVILTSMSAIAADRMANYYGNTLHVMPEKGGAHYVYYNPDRSFEVVFPEKRYKGIYTLEGNSVCLTAVRPPDTKQTTNCHGFDDSRKAGETWSETTPTGVVHFRLDAGRSHSD